MTKPLKYTYIFVLLIAIASIVVSLRNSCLPHFDPDVISIIEFSTTDGAFTYTVIPQKGRKVETLESNFADWKKEKGRIQDAEIYRTTKKNWCNLGNWMSYLTQPHWQYPYLEI